MTHYNGNYRRAVFDCRIVRSATLKYIPQFGNGELLFYLDIEYNNFAEGWINYCHNGLPAPYEGVEESYEVDIEDVEPEENSNIEGLVLLHNCSDEFVRFFENLSAVGSWKIEKLGTVKDYELELSDYPPTEYINGIDIDIWIKEQRMYASEEFARQAEHEAACLAP